MKTPPVLLGLALLASPVLATEQIVTLGDSLSFAYEAEFCFKKTVTGVGTIGDNMPATARNWVEILSNPANPANRADRFELGTRHDVVVTPPFDPPFSLYFRQNMNWAIPGIKIHDLRQFLAGQATFTSIIGADPGFSTLNTILQYSDFNNATDFGLPELENQIQNIAERVTILVGGNDFKAIYGTIYNGGSAGTFADDFMADLTAVLDRIQTLNPNVQIVVANVAHVGITPFIRASYPYDPVKTELVSAVVRDVNTRIANLVSARKLGLADIYTPTLPLINGTTKLCVHGVTFVVDPGTSTGNLANVWLNGPTSNNFHPNTNAQAVIANEVIHAFNVRYRTGIAPLTATEMLVGVSGKTAVDVEIPFATWINKFGLAGKPASDDTDGDGIPAGVEFALGLNPVRADADYVTTGVVGNTLDFAYPQRLPGSARYTITPESSATLSSGFTPFATPPTAAADGLFHATLPLGSGAGFLRLKATTSP